MLADLFVGLCLGSRCKFVPGFEVNAGLGEHLPVSLRVGFCVSLLKVSLASSTSLRVSSRVVCENTCIFVYVQVCVSV